LSDDIDKLSGSVGMSVKRKTIVFSFLVENGLIRLSGILTIFLFILIVLFLALDAIPFLFEYNFYDFITGTGWYPLSGIFGVLPLIFGSVLITILATLFAIPLSIGTALFLSEITTPRVRTTLKVVIEVLASIPSVVFGFFGIILVGPFLEHYFHVTSGLNAFTAAVMLAFMSIPTITSVSEEALQAVPKSLKYASLALGASKLQTMIRVTLPAANSGIVAGIMLGVGRAIGETMTVMMVAGGAANITANIFAPVRTITGTIASEMGEVIFGDQHYHALFMLGLMLFFITLGVNMLSSYAINRIKNSKKKNG
jgi:phosphate transport system permease protein